MIPLVNLFVYSGVVLHLITRWLILVILDDSFLPPTHLELLHCLPAEWSSGHCHCITDTASARVRDEW